MQWTEVVYTRQTAAVVVVSSEPADSSQQLKATELILNMPETSSATQILSAEVAPSSVDSKTNGMRQVEVYDLFVYPLNMSIVVVAS